MKIIAIIPARGGSKEIPGKNLFPINGKPLLYYTVSACLNSTLVNRTVVSTDNDEISRVANQGYIEVPTKLEDNLVFENKEAHLWHLTFDDVNQIINIARKSKKNAIFLNNDIIFTKNWFEPLKMNSKSVSIPASNL